MYRLRLAELLVLRLSTTLKAGSGVFVGMATRAYMEEAVLSAGLTFIPGAKLSASIEEATFAIDGDGAVQRNAVGKFVDTDFATIRYVTDVDVAQGGTITLKLKFHGSCGSYPARLLPCRNGSYRVERHCGWDLHQ